MIHRDLTSQRRDFLRAIGKLANDPEIKSEQLKLEGKLVNVMRNYKDAISSFLNNEKTFEELEKEKNPWTFLNSMFFCGTIYTTIGEHMSIIFI
ncbi:unnamed protein product [Ceratitis capitata]|uniref:(Mediterranean fruit fly) hypothetical protein n=1 Tax=Ceratitis capitata TaxID=7213 RepID=A0A811VDI9_CERCA|nr:unnamed protein product [Ceratitis capitata]